MVLVVEDNDDQREMLAVLFRQAGYRVISARDGVEGMEAAKRERPDLIISDVNMPRADGVELCLAIRADENLSHIPIVLVSGLRKDTPSVVEGLRAGADEYLEIPYSPMRLVALATRLIERKRGDDAVRASEERYRAFIAHSSEGIWRFELDIPCPVALSEDEQLEFFYKHGYLAECNDCMARMYGFESSTELLGVRLSDFLPRFAPENEAYIRAFIGSGYRLNDMESVELDRWGERKIFLNNLVGIVEGEFISRAWGTQRDSTESRRAADALRASEERFHAFMDNSPALSFMKDEEGRFVFVSRPTEEFLKRGREEWLGKTGHDMWPEPVASMMRESDLSTLASGCVDEFILELPNASGENRSMLSLKFPLKDSDGRMLIGVVAVDVTEHLRAEEENKRLVHQLNERVKELTALSAVGQILQNVEQSIPELLRAVIAQLPGAWQHSDVAAARISVGEEEISTPGFAVGEWMQRAEFTLAGDVRAAVEVVYLEERPEEAEGPFLAEERLLINSVAEMLRSWLDRRLAQEALGASEERYRDLVENAIDIIYTHDLKGNYTSVNRAGETILGYTREEAIGMNIIQMVSPEDMERVQGMVSQKLGGCGETTYELEVVAKDGRRAPLEVNTKLIREGGVTVGVQGIARDITERKRAEAALLEANERAILEYEQLLERLATLAQSLGVARDLASVFRAILDFTLLSTPCSTLAISLYDADARTREVVYLWYNGDEHEVAGLDAIAVGGGVVGRAVATGEVQFANDDYFARVAGKTTTVRKGYDQDPRDPRSALIAPMAYKGGVVGVIELQCYDEAAYTSEHATTMRMAANLTANAVENVRLLEREREKEEQLRHSQRLESVGKLAGGVAHDFNNLLVAINGYSDLSLRRLKEDDPIRYNVEEIRRAGERAAALTRQLLAFSRKQVMQPVVLSLNGVVTEMDKMLRRVIGEDIELVTTLASDLGNVKADPNMLEQVVMNLCVNSRDAMPHGGRLVVETSNVRLDEEYASHRLDVRPGRYVCLAVSDTGEGMDAKTKSRIFEPFFTTKEMGKGTGLGLSTVYGIVNQSGGNIWVYSEVGHGTVFRVYLPRVEEPQAEEVAGAQDAPLPIGSEKILLVEDDEMVRRVTREIVSEQGYRVLEAVGLDEAIRACEEHPDLALLLTDVVMPQINGKELAARLTKCRPSLRVVFMSGYSEAVVNNGILEEGIEFVQKPFTPTVLLRKLREVLDADPTSGRG